MFGDGDKGAQSRPQLSAEMSSWQVFVVDLLIFPVRRNKTQSVSELAVWQAAGRIAGKGGGKRYARTGSASQNDRLPVNFFVVRSPICRCSVNVWLFPHTAGN